jgi:hypothetical protein
MRVIGRLVAGGLALWAAAVAAALVLAAAAVVVALVAALGVGVTGGTLSPLPEAGSTGEPVGGFGLAEGFERYCLEVARGEWREVGQEATRSHICWFADSDYIFCEGVPLACFAIGDVAATSGRRGTPADRTMEVVATP